MVDTPIQRDGDLFTFDNSYIFRTEFSEYTILVFSGGALTHLLNILEHQNKIRHIEVILRTCTYKLRKYEYLAPIIVELSKN